MRFSLRTLRDSAFGKRYIGDKAFFMTVLAIIVPVIIQNSISNFVNLLDNIMVGAVGTEQMSGVSITNQLMFVFNLCVFGGISGATIFGAQFFGAKNNEGVRDTFRFAILISVILTVLGVTVFSCIGEKLINLYINETEATAAAEDTVKAAREYLAIMLFGLFPFAVSQSYAGMLRVTGETKLPMYASISAVLTNLTFNYLLIFEHPGLGFSGLGVRGAAIATVIARYIEMGIIVVISHRRARKGRYVFLTGAYRRFRIPVRLAKEIFVRGMPLLLNEALWSIGIATLNIQYSMRGLVVVAAFNICSTLTNLFNVFFLSMGTAASVLVGQALGAGDNELARWNVRRIYFFEIALCLVIGAVLASISGVLPMLYTSADAAVRSLTTKLILVSAAVMPLSGFAHCSYFILRSGGRTGITFLFDCVYTWLVPIPIAFLLVRYTQLNVVAIYAACQSAEIVKDIIGYILIKRGVWIRNIVV